MTHHTDPLRNVKVAAPCPADWDAMVGTDRARHCGQCRLNVYNLSSMTRPEAESLLTQHEGCLCVRFYRRADGTILTQNCPAGLRAARQKVSRWATAAFASILGFFGGVGAVVGLRNTPEQPGRVMGAIAVPTERQAPNWDEIGPPPGVPQGEMVMGGIAPLPHKPAKK